MVVDTARTRAAVAAGRPRPFATSHSAAVTRACIPSDGAGGGDASSERLEEADHGESLLAPQLSEDLEGAFRRVEARAEPELSTSVRRRGGADLMGHGVDDERELHRVSAREVSNGDEVSPGQGPGLTLGWRLD